MRRNKGVHRKKRVIREDFAFVKCEAPPYNRGHEHPVGKSNGGIHRTEAKTLPGQRQGRIGDEVCGTCGFGGKYAGNRIYKTSKGHGTYDSKKGLALLKRDWRTSGCMYMKYLK